MIDLLCKWEVALIYQNARCLNALQAWQTQIENNIERRTNYQQNCIINYCLSLTMVQTEKSVSLKTFFSFGFPRWSINYPLSPAGRWYVHSWAQRAELMSLLFHPWVRNLLQQWKYPSLWQKLRQKKTEVELDLSLPLELNISLLQQKKKKKSHAPSICPTCPCIFLLNPSSASILFPFQRITHTSWGICIVLKLVDGSICLLETLTC